MICQSRKINQPIKMSIEKKDGKSSWERERFGAATE